MSFIEKNEQSKDYIRVNNTEVVKDDLSPYFAKEIVIKPAKKTPKMKLEIYDFDNKKDKELLQLSKHKYIGYAEFFLSDLLKSTSKSLSIEIKNKKNRGIGSITTIKYEERNSIEKNEFVLLEICAVGLPKMDLVGKSDPYVEIHRQSN